MNIIRSFQNKSKTIRYLLANCTNYGEQKIIDACIAFAYNASGFAMQSLKSGGAIGVSQKIYGDMFDAPRLIDAYKRIMELVDSRLKIRREPIFISESGEEFKEVLSSASLSAKEIIVYDSLCSEILTINSRLNSKIASILHEIAHLIGLKSDAGFGDINSAECLQNFTLLICGIIDISDIQSGMENLKGKDGELPNWETQPRAPAGTHEGGQWIKEGAPTTPSKKAQKTRACLNLQDGGVKVDERGNWCAGNLDITAEKPNTRYSVVVEYEYTYFSEKEGKEVTETTKIAIDSYSDKNNKISIDRVGVLGEYNNDVKNNRFQNGNIKIKVKISIAEGSVKENYGTPDKPKDPDNYNSKGNDDDKKRYGLGFYPILHAAQDYWLKQDGPDDYEGGGISGRKDPKHLKKIGEGTINFEDGVTTIEGDLLNSAPGKY
ncbi:MAG: hypothetical protein J6P03_07810 [Opitutales bacterium]|nr:hypothetical protein [Opitutales bacterium]